jgi:hypothetical protein
LEIKTADAAETGDRLIATDINIHGTTAAAFLTTDTGFTVPTDFEDPDLIKKNQQGAVGTGMFIPGLFDKE